MTSQSNIVEIAYLRSGFVRIIQAGTLFEGQTMRIRGPVKHGPGALPTFWAKLYGVYDREKAIRLMESYA